MGEWGSLGASPHNKLSPGWPSGWGFLFDTCNGLSLNNCCKEPSTAFLLWEAHLALARFCNRLAGAFHCGGHCCNWRRAALASQLGLESRRLEESRSRRLGALAKSALASELSPGHGGAIVSSAPGATAEFVLAPSCLVFQFRGCRHRRCVRHRSCRGQSVRASRPARVHRRSRRGSAGGCRVGRVRGSERECRTRHDHGDRRQPCRRGDAAGGHGS